MAEATVERARMVEACTQAANLYAQLARDPYTRGTADALHAAAAALDRPPPAPERIAGAAAFDELLAVVSVACGLRERAPDGRWLLDDETMQRLEAAYAPMKRALTAPRTTHPRRARCTP